MSLSHIYTQTHVFWSFGRWIVRPVFTKQYTPNSCISYPSWKPAVLCVSAAHYLWYTLLSPSWGIWRSSPESTESEAQANCSAQMSAQILHCNPGWISAASPLRLVYTHRFISSLISNLQSSANCSTSGSFTLSRWLVCVPSAVDRQQPPGSVALTLMTTAVTKQEDNSRDKKYFKASRSLSMRVSVRKVRSWNV